MFEPFKINRVLPPHELNARRDRKRTLANLPTLAHPKELEPRDHKEQSHPNDQVFNPGNLLITHDE
jgi:hypothetical protein